MKPQISPVTLPYRPAPIAEVARDIERRRRIAHLLRLPGIAHLSRMGFRVCEKILSYRDTAKSHDEIVARQSALASGDLTIGQTGYSSQQEELKVAMAYKDEIDNGFTNGTSFSKLLYDRQAALVGNIIANDEIDTFVNFGASYGHIDSILARRHPHVKFVGVDRSDLTRRYNEFALAPLPGNLRFEASDILDFLANNKARNGIFFHARTATYMTEELLAKIYAAAAKAGYRHVVGYEPFGMSRVTGSYYEFSTKPSRSVAYLFGMNIHNYPALLATAGYSLDAFNVMQIEHSNPDHRALEFSARLA